MDNTDDHGLSEQHNTHRYRKVKKKKYKERNRKLTLFVKAFALVIIILIIVIAAGSNKTTSKNQSAGVASTKSSPKSGSAGRIPDFKYSPRESESVEDKLWQNRPGAVVNK